MRLADVMRRPQQAAPRNKRGVSANAQRVRSLLSCDGEGSPSGIRTRDLRLERAVSWAARRWGQPRPAAEPLAAGPGFEPGLPDPESGVLPLHHPAMRFAPPRSIPRAGAPRQTDPVQVRRYADVAPTP